MRLAPLSLFLALALLTACDGGPGESLYDPDRTSRLDPSITNVQTDASLVLAGIDVVTIQGANFVPGETIVYVEDGQGGVARGELLSETPTELRVRMPNFPGNALTIRIAVLGAENYSSRSPITLTSAFSPFGDLDPRSGSLEGPAAVVGDGTGNLIVSISRGGSAGGIVRFSPEGVREVIVNSRTLWNDLALGGATGDQLFSTQNVQAIFTLPTGQPVLPILPSSLIRLSAIADDSEGRIWAGGSAGTVTNPVTPRLHRFNLDGTVTSTDFPNTSVSDIRVFNDYVYVAGTRTGATPEAKVWKLPILSDGTLGAEEVVYDVATDQPGLRPSAIAVAADGTVLVGIAPPTSEPRGAVEFPIIVVRPDGSADPLYPGVLPGPVSALAWGAGSELYLVQSSIPPPAGETGTPAPAVLYRVETRIQGRP